MLTVFLIKYFSNSCIAFLPRNSESNFFSDLHSKFNVMSFLVPIEQCILDTNAGKQLSEAATDV